MTELFNELVEPEKEKRLREKPFPQVETFFHRPEIEPLVEFNLRVPITRYNKTLQIPYVFTNGDIHNVMPQRFTSTADAIRVIGEGRILTQFGSRTGKKKVFNLLPKAEPTSEHPHLQDEILDVLDSLKGENVRVIVESDIEGFLDELKAKAKTH